MNLFKGYKTCHDKGFRSYISNLENQHNDGTRTLEPNDLMTMASNYYRKRLEQSDSPWESDPIEEKLTALEAKIARKAKSPSAKKPPQLLSKRPNWLQNNVKPKNPKETKSYASNTYYWCGEETGGKCNGRWRIHRPSECQGFARPGASPSEKKDGLTAKGKAI